MCEVADYAFALGGGVGGRGLGEGEVDGGCLAPGFGGLDADGGEADGGASEEGEVELYEVWLVLGGEDGAEVEGRSGLDGGGYKAAIGDWRASVDYKRVGIGVMHRGEVGGHIPVPMHQSEGKCAEYVCESIAETWVASEREDIIPGKEQCPRYYEGAT